MLNNLLADYDYKLFNNGIETGLFVFILGILVVFLGIAIIVFVISTIGKIIPSVTAKKSGNKTTQKKSEGSNSLQITSANAAAAAIPAETVAVITAAIAAYYSQNSQSLSKCDFVVKKIKKRG